jgi:magnesium chelatase family protein
MDLTIETPPVSALDLASPSRGEPTAPVAARVLAARERQWARGAINAHLNEKQLAEVATPAGEALALLRRACEQMRLSARGYTRILRVARTLADLDGKDAVGRVHIAEAISYRQPEAQPATAR